MNGFFSPLAACSYIVLHEQPQTLHTSNQETLDDFASKECTTSFNVVVCNVVVLLYTVSPTSILYYILSMTVSSLKARLCM